MTFLPAELNFRGAIITPATDVSGVLDELGWGIDEVGN